MTWIWFYCHKVRVERRYSDEIIYHPYADPATAFILIGFVFFLMGVTLAVYYSYKRSKLMERLPK